MQKRLESQRYQRRENYFDIKAINAFINDLIFWIKHKKKDPFELGKALAVVIGEISSEAIESYQDI